MYKYMIFDIFFENMYKYMILDFFNNITMYGKFSEILIDCVDEFRYQIVITTHNYAEISVI